MFPALRHKNLRLYLSGQLISLIGTWMQQLAMSWLVYRMTHSPFLLGLVSFCSLIPSFALSLFAGVWVDRTNLHRLLIWTQSLSAIQATLLTVLTLSGVINLPEILILSLFIGVINAIDTPARQSFLVQMIGDDKSVLPNAIALNSTVMNGTRMVGPALAGFLVSWAGEGVCFLLNSMSYIAVLFALFSLKVKPHRKNHSPDPVMKSLKEGMSFAFGVKPIEQLLILLFALSLIGSPYTTLLPLMADQVFKGGAHTLGFLTTATGLGALTSTVWLASRRSSDLSSPKFQTWIGICALVFSIALIGLSQTHQLLFALPVLWICGFAMLYQMAGSNIRIQTLVDDDKRGRVMSLFTLCLMGIAPFGSLLVGAFAERFGIFHTLLLSGLGYLVVAIWFLKRIHTKRKLMNNIHGQIEMILG